MIGITDLNFAGVHFMELTIELLGELFSGWIGVLSFAVIASMLGMGVFFLRLFLRNDGDNP